MLPVLVCIIVIVLICCNVIRSVIKPEKFPPGPIWYPFFGSSSIVQQMTSKHGSQWKALLELSKQWSTQVLGLKLGRELVVVVYGEKNVRQVFSESEFDGRPNSFFYKLRCLGKRLGVTFVDGPLWREHRQFTVKHLKNVGFGKTSMELEIQNELKLLREYINDNKHKPIKVDSMFSSAVMNVLWKYVAGERIREDKLERLLELFYLRSKAFTLTGGLLSQIPWCRFIIPGLSGYKLIVDLNQQISEIIEEAIKKHLNKEVQQNDFIYSFLDEMNEENKASFTYDQLKTVCLDLIIAGSQTTGNAVKFALLSVLRNKNIQEKIFNEIENTIGDSMPCWADSSKLVYTSAFLLEVMRIHTIAPLAGPRRVLQDTVIDGYVIPKETTVLISLADIHLDPNLWPDPHEIKPERFIDEKGLSKSNEHIYPFGSGRRRCPGDSLARSFVFIIFVGILQKYRIDCVNGVLPSNEADIGLLAAPKPFVANFVSRE
ncbi:probable cytochrome P450 305a1 isoform X1 [Bombyx mandarina]|uniref:Cytochrome P450 n=4 Tax=Bombyx TaxID=7090 RepID=Q9NDL3_BOMMO|nr:cytochrome P450 Cyp305B1 precursor [Bombyx mori]XP_028032183.1 probable cytochrome P450 305a1 isoform X1 [Bombyx mandarina]XP_028032184.1 probable cytochrome P450 305a1 isoform X1 [Bombyx mandarina]XP_028032185.1 probable cytochrome P450 305a1 isoform X1 [Bombyx mandarina]XP_037870240.1 cytochrome P450 Cyp305B1 isoform X1 [Bombyx mori]ABC69163.1 cytochrome P450 CYP305B1V1 [Bombyx mandarina]ABD78849.1 cytochrome P450 Cyp305B1 [Bombyx mori]BAA96811.1 cytochrome P450 [Bombyx mori]